MGGAQDLKSLREMRGGGEKASHAQVCVSKTHRQTSKLGQASHLAGAIQV